MQIQNIRRACRVSLRMNFPSANCIFKRKKLAPNPSRVKKGGNPRVNELSRVKRGLFLAVTISLPLLFIICLELALRTFGYGVDVSLFKRHTVNGKIYYLENPNVKCRYFGTSPFTPSTSPEYFQMPKPKGVYRIFALGESTTVGYPYYYNASFPTFLVQRLKAIFPGRKIELINLGMTAANSYTALDMLRELDKYQPDLIVYYGGHNEFYGALGIASNQLGGLSRLAALFYLRLIRFRTFQLLQNVIHATVSMFSHRNGTLSHGTEMERVARGKLVPYESTEYKEAYSIFKENLLSMRKYCRKEDVPLIMGTQVSNLEDLPPFVSGNSSSLSIEEKGRFRQMFNAAVEYQSRGTLDSAIILLKSAIAIDPSYADAHFRLAECLKDEGDFKAAITEFTLARNYDELRFRTDTNFNDIIRSMGDGRICFVAHVVSAFKASSPDSLIGHNLITDHLHPYSRGNFIIAKCYAEVMRDHGLFASRQDWEKADTISDSTLWNERLVTKFDEIMAKEYVAYLSSGWPFKDQSPSPPFISPTDTLAQIASDAAVGRINWGKAHLEAIAYYESRGDLEDAAKEYRMLLNVYPLDLQLYSYLARVYLRENRMDDMENVMEQSLQVKPTIQAYRTLGDIMMKKGLPAAALAYYLKTDEFPQSPEAKLQNGIAISYAFARTGQYERARSRLIGVLGINPGFRPAVQLLNYVDQQLEKRSGPQK